MVSALTAVRDTIARAVLGNDEDAEVRVGHITLRRHQRDALRRVRTALREFGGVLLADDPGLGKTYVALALAREFARTVVCAPAALRSMWHDAAARSAVRVTFVSLEALSRRDADAQGDLVVVDEAHHACNPGAARYVRLARLAAGSRVLLLSATPVRNRRAELDALLALFLGTGASGLDDAARSRCIIQRSGGSELLPAIQGPHWHAAPPSPNIAAAIRGLPPPLPTLDGREARALLAMTLARCWASSLAALDAALRRRLQRGAALEAVLDAGRLPTRAELRAWVVGDDAMQLAFPALVLRVESRAMPMERVLHTHLAAVRELRARIVPCVRGDAAARAELLLSLRARHPHERMVAFSSHAVTAEAVFSALRRSPGVALLTARGARTASGARPREDVLAALSPSGGGRRPTRVDDISLVVTTDVLSEGVNLQGASVVVHLDVPWTPAGLEQRVGRAARLCSPHATVHVYGVAPPRATEGLLRLERRFARKHGERLAASSAPVEMERLRTRLAAWRLAAPLPAAASRVAAAHAKALAVLAVVGTRNAPIAIAGSRQPGGGWRFSEAPRDLLALAQVADEAEVAPFHSEVVPCEAEVSPCPADVSSARAAIRRWMRGREAHASSDAGHSASRARQRFFQRADAMLAAEPAHRRAHLAARFVHLRARLGAAVSAGAELLLLELARDASPSGDEWLAACERCLPRAAPTTGAEPRGAPHEILALLLLSPRSSARAPESLPRVPRATST